MPWLQDVLCDPAHVSFLCCGHDTQVFLPRLSISVALDADIICLASTLSDSADLVETLYGISGFDGPLYRCTGISDNTS